MGMDANNWAWQQETVHKLILLALADHCDKNYECFPSRDRLAKHCSCSVDKIDRALKALQAEGLVSKQQRYADGGRQTSNLYVLLVNVGTEEASFANCTKQEGEGRTDAAPQPQIAGGGGPQQVRPLELSEGTNTPVVPIVTRAMESANQVRKRSAPPPRQDHTLVEQAVGEFNRAAERFGFSRCANLTDQRERRLFCRLQDLGRGDPNKGLERFTNALAAIPHCPFIAGRVKPKPGDRPFRLNIDRLLSTGSGLGDVLAQLCDLYGEHGPGEVSAEKHCASDTESAQSLASVWQEAQAEELAAQQARRRTGNSDALH